MKRMDISSYQKRFWLEWKLDPKSSKYNTPLVYTLQGNLNIEALSQALSEYINHFHRSAKCYFEETQNGIEQCEPEHVDVNIDLIILSELKNLEQEKNAYIRKICQYNFDLSSPPLFKFGLLKISHSQYVLILNFHHIVTDAYTGEFMVQKVSQLYNYFAKAAPYPALLFSSYEDYVRNNRTGNQDPSLAQAMDLDFWKQKLQNFPLHVDFYSPKKNENTPHNLASSVYFSLEEEASSQFYKWVKKNKTTVFIALSTIFAVTLSRYAQQKSIVLSYPINTRPVGFHQTPGCFVNNVPFCVTVDTHQTLEQHITQCTAERREASRHPFCSLTEIIHSLKEDNNPLTNHYFNVSIVEAFLNLTPLCFEGIQISCEKSLNQESFNDLSLFYQSGKKLAFKLDYRKDCFEPLLIDAFINLFLGLIKIHPVNALPLQDTFSILEKNEYRLIESWNSSEKPFVGEKTLHALFRLQAQKTPNAIAVTLGKQSVTYQALDQQSEVLAAYIAQQMYVKQDLSLNKDTIIALYLEKSVELIVGILAILKAGYAYLPLDVEEVENRTQLILEDSAAHVILTNSKHFKNLCSLITSAKPILIDLDRNIAYTMAAEKPVENTSARGLSYLMYTSGSTGKPKGVMIEHQSVVNLILDMKNRIGFSHTDSVLSLTSIAFDIYALELFLPLLSGGQHIICPNVIRRDPIEITYLIKKNRPSFIQATPTLWAMLTPHLQVKNANFTILCGGEVLAEKLALRLKEISSSVWNVYGPTETTIWSSAYKLENDTLPYIGRALANTQLHVLDEECRGLPIGVIGELYIAGIGLAKGYWQDSALTDLKFVHHPVTNTRLYKTGDRVRWALNGQLEYISRVDNQVKIRGHRVELDEIEAALNTHSGIHQCTICIQVYEGVEILVAYYVLRKNSFLNNFLNGWKSLSIEDLHQYLKGRLSAHMLPTAFVALDILPMTTQGKIDKLKLPLPNLSHYLGYSESAKPSDALELQLIALWRSILALPNMGLNDNFFGVGGNSLLAVYLVAKINEQFNVHYPVSWILKNPTIKNQAAELRKDKNLVCPYQALIPFNVRGKTSPVFLIHPGLAGAEVYAELAYHLDKNIPFYAIDSYNLNTDKHFIKTIEELTKVYIDALKQIQAVGPYLLGGWSLGGMIAYEMAQQLNRSGDEVTTLYLLDTHIYARSYLEYMQKFITVKRLIKELPIDRGKYLASLPPKHLTRVVASLKNDIALLIQYTIKPYTGKVVLAQTTLKTPLSLGLMKDGYNGWKKYIKNISRIQIESTHFDLMEGTAAKMVAEILKNDIFNTAVDKGRHSGLP